MSDILIFTVTESSVGIRVDKFISDETDRFTRSSIVKLIEENAVQINGQNVSKNYKCRIGDEIVIHIPKAKPMEAMPENIPLDIVYEDNDLLVVNKPKGMVVHPAPGNEDGTLVNALLYHCKDSLSGINGVIRPGIVHRIDKDTSGLLIVAKNDSAHLSLAHQIKEHSFHRAYEAIVRGNIKEDSGTINQPIGRHYKDRKKMAVTARNSRNAITHFTVIDRFSSFTHVRCVLETGRTHQIRVHMAYINHPIAGDTVYGVQKALSKLNGQCLHAKEIGFMHPSTGEYMEFTSELPRYFTEFLSALKNKDNGYINE